VAGFWVGIKGDLTGEQREALKTGGIVVDDLRLISAGYGTPTHWETMRTCVHVPAVDESEAKAGVARAVGVDADDLLVFSAEIFRWKSWAELT
jgi:precorrin isomerase